jgi:hypothetical protein
LTPAPPRPSGSIIRNAKLLVPAGGLIHDNCGEIFSPTQLGFCGSFARLFAALTGIIWPSWKVVDDSWKIFCCAFAAPPADATMIAPARTGRASDGFMAFLNSAPWAPA